MNYIVLSNLKSGGKLYRKGDSIDMGKGEAKILVEGGVLEAKKRKPLKKDTEKPLKKGKERK